MQTVERDELVIEAAAPAASAVAESDVIDLGERVVVRHVDLLCEVTGFAAVPSGTMKVGWIPVDADEVVHGAGETLASLTVSADTAYRWRVRVTSPTRRGVVQVTNSSGQDVAAQGHAHVLNVRLQALLDV